MPKIVKPELKPGKVLDRLQQVWPREGLWRYTPQMVILAATILTIVLMFPASRTFQFTNLKVGDVYVGDEIIAPFIFDINKSEEEIAHDRKLAAERVPFVFVRSDSIARSSIEAFDRFFQKLDSIRVAPASDSAKLQAVQRLLSKYSIIMEQSTVPSLYRPELLAAALDSTDHRSGRKGFKNGTARAKSTFDYLKRNFRRILVDIYAIGILNLSSEEIPQYLSKVSIVSPDGEMLEELGNFFNVDTYREVVLSNLRQTFGQKSHVEKVGYPIIIAFLKPNLLYDKTETDRRIQEAIDNVPLAKGFVLKNERIVGSHEIVTKEILDKLRSLAEAMAEKQAHEGGIRLFLPYLGRALIVMLALSFVVTFLFVSRKEIFEDEKKMVMVFLTMMLVVVIAFLMNEFDLASNYKYLIPISIASMLLTIFFDRRMAFASTVTLSILLGALRGNEFEIMMVSLFVGTVATYAVHEVQARVWILRGMISISAAYVVSIGTIEFLKGAPISKLWEMWLFGILNGIFSPILTYGLMIIFEYIFKMTTDSTLLELSDLNKPLLRQLAIRAPGTYHHSIMVGNLSEAAAEAIGANALLARVASYYHDIGKMDKPEYFVENQKGGKNPHEKLTPTMSCLILISHVKRGLEIAEQFKLPREICEFIPQHHGTNLIKFFYHKALENAKAQNGEAEVNEASFRYHGPRPQSKEAGIVMLADAVEAGSRTLKDPTISRIKSMVNSVIQERLLDAELEECPLTLRDLKRIAESFVNNLAGMFHGRVEYPGQSRTSKKIKV
ncbi:MAG: HDIG domain-containing protein [Calditrichaeota bacterium]|nr:MAG: HDIG domain-containing protein [Calditrichota bacterium]